MYQSLDPAIFEAVRLSPAAYEAVSYNKGKTQRAPAASSDCCGTGIRHPAGGNGVALHRARRSTVDKMFVARHLQEELAKKDQPAVHVLHRPPTRAYDSVERTLPLHYSSSIWRATERARRTLAVIHHRAICGGMTASVRMCLRRTEIPHTGSRVAATLRHSLLRR